LVLDKHGIKKQSAGEKLPKKIALEEEITKLEKEAKRLSDYTATILIVCVINLLLFSLTQDVILEEFCITRFLLRNPTLRWQLPYP